MWATDGNLPQPSHVPVNLTVQFVLCCANVYAHLVRARVRAGGRVCALPALAPGYACMLGCALLWAGRAVVGRAVGAAQTDLELCEMPTFTSGRELFDLGRDNGGAGACVRAGVPVMLLFGLPTIPSSRTCTRATAGD